MAGQCWWGDRVGRVFGPAWRGNEHKRAPSGSTCCQSYNSAGRLPPRVDRTGQRPVPTRSEAIFAGRVFDPAWRIKEHKRAPSRFLLLPMRNSAWRLLPWLGRTGQRPVPTRSEAAPAIFVGPGSTRPDGSRSTRGSFRFQLLPKYNSLGTCLLGLAGRVRDSSLHVRKQLQSVWRRLTD